MSKDNKINNYKNRIDDMPEGELSARELSKAEERSRLEEKWRDKVKSRLQGELNEGEEIVEALAPEARLAKFHLMLSLLGFVSGCLSITLALLLMFAPENFSGSDQENMFIFWIVIGTLFIICGGIILALSLGAFKRGGLLLTKERIYGYGGFFYNKRVDVNLLDISNITVVDGRGESYFLAIKGTNFIYMQNPAEFEAAFYEQKKATKIQ